MTEANVLVERMVTHEKGIHAFDDKGNRHHFKKGEKVKLSARSAKAFARYLEAPGVAAAKAEVVKEEAAADVVPPTPPVPPAKPKETLIPEAAPKPGAVATKPGGGS